MKTLFTLLFSLLVVLPSLADPEPYVLKGVIADGEESRPMEMANVVLLKNDTLLVMGTTTDLHGTFHLGQVEAGNYRLKVTVVGYEPLDIALEGVERNTDLGTLVMHELSKQLAEVSVTASNTVSKIDRKVIMPTDMQKKAAANGAELIRQLGLPKVNYNPMDNSLSSTDGGTLQLRINGVKVTPQEIKALRPDDIVRVEYHDNPSLRYGDVSVVLDYIVKRRESGGNLMFDGSVSPYVGFVNNNTSAKVNYKKSEFSAYYGTNWRDLYHWYRDSEESYNYPDGKSIKRIEKGTPGRLNHMFQWMGLSYNLKPNDKATFNAALRYNIGNRPQMEYRSVLYNTTSPDRKIDMFDRDWMINLNPELDLYYEQKLKNEQTLFINVVGSYGRSSSGRIYKESIADQILTDVTNNILANTYTLIGEAIYEKQFKAGVLSGGAKHTQTFSDNTFSGTADALLKMQQSESYLYTEWQGKVNKFSYRGGVGVSRNWFCQEGGQGYENYTFRPTVTLQYNFDPAHSIRLKGWVNNASPSLTELSDVDQVIDSLQIQRGNPLLKPYINYHLNLNYELKRGIFTGNLSGGYRYSPDAIMEEKFVEDGKFVRSFFNQPGFQRLNGEMTLMLAPFKGALTLKFTNGVNHYLSDGQNYRHRYTNYYFDAMASYTLKKVTFFGQIFSNNNYFFGETLSGGENLHILGVQYKNKNIRVGAMVINPFIDNYCVKNENWSSVASYYRNGYINESSRLAAVTLNYTLDFGRKYSGGNKRLNNNADGGGVKNAGK